MQLRFEGGLTSEMVYQQAKVEYASTAALIIQAEKFNIQIEVQYPEEKMGKLFVDSEKIAWVLTNLLSNAIQNIYRITLILIQ